MVQLNEAEALVTAWRALNGREACEGRRTIPVSSGVICRLLAGRHFPGSEEAVLVGFRPVQIPANAYLPEGNGFVVRKVDFELESERRIWFALLRQAAGSLDMFTIMAADVVTTLNSSGIEIDEQLLGLFLGRIRAWQGFMKHGNEGVLSPESEVGLHGELLVLEALIEAGLPPATAIDSWYGPIDGVQDFQLGTGAIEVKTTISIGGFSASVTSLEQLDSSLVKPLFLAGVRLRLDETGINLPERVAAIRKMLQLESAALIVFESRLLHAGFSSAMSLRYTRRFSHDRTMIFHVDDCFPALTRSRVPNEIRKIRYEIDLELVKTADISLDFTLQKLGVL